MLEHSSFSLSRFRRRGYTSEHLLWLNDGSRVDMEGEGKIATFSKTDSHTPFLLTSRALKSSGKCRNAYLHVCSDVLLKQGTTVCPKVLVSSGYLCIRAWFANDFPTIFLSISSLIQNTFINPLLSRAPSPQRKVSEEYLKV